MKQIRGYINKACERWDRDVYIGELNSFKFENRLQDLLEEFENKKVLIRWAVAKEPFDCIDIELCNQMYGIANTEWSDFRYSEVSSGTYTCNIVGGHNLTEWLSNYRKYYVVIEIRES